MDYNDLASEQLLNIKTLGELRQAGYQPKDIKTELRDNLIKRIRSGDEVFPGIWGYEDTVVPGSGKGNTVQTQHLFARFAGDRPKPGWPGKWSICWMSIFR